MAQEDYLYMTQDDLDAALDYAIKLLETMRVVVQGAMYQDGRVVFRAKPGDWSLMTLAVRGRPDCGCGRPGQAGS